MQSPFYTLPPVPQPQTDPAWLPPTRNAPAAWQPFPSKQSMGQWMIDRQTGQPVTRGADGQFYLQTNSPVSPPTMPPSTPWITYQSLMRSAGLTEIPEHFDPSQTNSDPGLPIDPGPIDPPNLVPSPTAPPGGTPSNPSYPPLGTGDYGQLDPWNTGPNYPRYPYGDMPIGAMLGGGNVPRSEGGSAPEIEPNYSGINGNSRVRPRVQRGITRNASASAGYVPPRSTPGHIRPGQYYDYGSNSIRNQHSMTSREANNLLSWFQSMGGTPNSTGNTGDAGHTMYPGQIGRLNDQGQYEQTGTIDPNFRNNAENYQGFVYGSQRNANRNIPAIMNAVRRFGG